MKKVLISVEYFCGLFREDTILPSVKIENGIPKDYFLIDIKLKDNIIEAYFDNELIEEQRVIIKKI